MVLSAIGNITVLVLLIRRRQRTPSRLDVMLTHLAIADLMVKLKIISSILRKSFNRKFNHTSDAFESEKCFESIHGIFLHEGEKFKCSCFLIKDG